MNSVADGIVLLDLEGTINWLSSSAETIFDYPRDAAVGASIDLLLPLPAEHGGSLLDRLQGPRPGGVPLELTLRRRSGELLPVEVESSVVEQRDRRMIVLVLRDLTGRRQTEETLRSLAYHDPLTGLPNRLLFHDRLSQAIERARRARQLLTVMLVDLDRFKLINDSLGLDAGRPDPQGCRRPARRRRCARATPWPGWAATNSWCCCWERPVPRPPRGSPRSCWTCCGRPCRSTATS